MKFKDSIRRQSYIITVVAILLALSIGGASYAFFFQVKSNSNYQVVKTGDLSVTSVVSGASSDEKELLPISDLDAVAVSGTTGYLTATVTVDNDGSLSSTYDLIVDYDLPSGKDLSDMLGQNYIGVAVFKVDGSKTLLTSGTLNSYQLFDDSTTARILLDDQKLAKSGSGASSITYEVRIWVKDTIDSSAIDKLIYLKTNVVSEVDSETELSK